MKGKVYASSRPPSDWVEIQGDREAWATKDNRKIQLHSEETPVKLDRTTEEELAGG